MIRVTVGDEEKCRANDEPERVHLEIGHSMKEDSSNKYTDDSGASTIHYVIEMGFVWQQIDI